MGYASPAAATVARMNPQQERRETENPAPGAGSTPSLARPFRSRSQQQPQSAPRPSAPPMRSRQRPEIDDRVGHDNNRLHDFRMEVSGGRADLPPAAPMGSQGQEVMHDAYGPGGSSRPPQGRGRFWEMMQRMAPRGGMLGRAADMAPRRRSEPSGGRDPYRDFGDDGGYDPGSMSGGGGGGGIRSMLLRMLMGGGQ